jgi:copper homeostasis protein (lipoprotein)
MTLCSLLALAACDREATPADRGRDADVAAAPGDAGAPAGEEMFERTWLGVLPCADCDGIQTRLELVREGDRRTYRLEETYLGADGDAVFSQQGEWVQEGEGEGARLRLDPGTPAGRRFVQREDGALDQLDGRGEPLQPDGQYRLQRL